MNAKVFSVLIKCCYLDSTIFRHVLGVITTRGRWHVMVRHSNCFIRCAHLTSGHAQAFKRLWASHLVNEVAVDIQKTGAVFGFMGNVCVPDFIIERFGGHCPLPNNQNVSRSGVQK